MSVGRNNSHVDAIRSFGGKVSYKKMGTQKHRLAEVISSQNTLEYLNTLHVASFRTLPSSNSTPLFNENVQPGKVVLYSIILEPIYDYSKHSLYFPNYKLRANNLPHSILTKAYLLLKTQVKGTSQ
uniref:Uncharacterized protein n=1 Tax=Glossina austeni TaxID=7395 RepID=A0A1A9UI87_GLOAU